MPPVTPPIAAFLGPLSGLETFLTLAVLVLLFMVWRLTRHQESHFSGEPELTICEALDALAGSTQGRVVGGNAVKLIQNEAFFDAVTQAMVEARRSVHLETFLWHDGEASERIVSALEAAGRRGLEVRVLSDAVGSFWLSRKTLARLRDAGCKIGRFHRWNPSNLGRLNVRDHRKIIVIDGRTAFVGGHCITDDWLKDGPKLPRFRDITARIQGPVVGTIQSCFLENWIEVTGELLTSHATFPSLGEVGDVRAHVAYVRPDHCPSSVQVLHYLAISLAKKRIRIQNPYFLPDPNGAKALVKAAKRGVDVRIMIPALKATDSPLPSRAGRYQFRRLLKGGVKIFEYQTTLLHQKVISVDGLWCGIGSSNFDDRSFEINDEITVGLADPDTVAELERTFEMDLEKCRELDWKTWKKRPRRDKLLDGVLYLFSEQF
jgi:cardiolipin synthase